MQWPDLGPGEWRKNGRLAYLRPIRWVVHGVLAERSGEPDRIYVWHVVTPLTTPLDVLNLDWSERIGGGSQTFQVPSSEADAALMEAADRARRLHARDPIVVDPPGGADSVGMQEERAYGLLAAGDGASAAEVLRRVLQYPPSYEWEMEIAERARAILELLGASNSAAALGLIDGWRTSSLHGLRLDE